MIWFLTSRIAVCKLINRFHYSLFDLAHYYDKFLVDCYRLSGCVNFTASSESAESSEESPLTTLWSQTFVDYQRWQGTYRYDGQRVPFHFQATLAEANHVEALFRDGSAVFELNGN